MFGWFKKKESNIKTVAVFGLPTLFSSAVYENLKLNAPDKKIEFVSGETKYVSHPSFLLAKNNDLNLCIHNLSYLKKDCLEVVYLDDDEESKNLALLFEKLFKKYFKHRELIVLGVDRNTLSLIALKKLKRKLFIKPSGLESPEDISDFLTVFLGKV